MQTRSAWLDGAEVTEVWFDAQTITLAQLLARGEQSHCAQTVWTTSEAQLSVAKQRLGERARRLVGEPRPDRDAKYYLRQTLLRFVPMTATQAARCNADAAPASKQSPERWLSPRQLELLRRIETGAADWPIAIDVAIDKAWAALPADSMPRK